MKSPSLKSCYTAIDRFLMSPGDLRILNVIRPMFGIFLTINILFLWPDRHLFFGTEGFITDNIYPFYSNLSWKITTFLPRNEFGVNIYFLMLLGSLVSLTTGVWPRLSAAMVFVLYSGLQNTNNLIFDGEDTMFRIFAFYLIFAPTAHEIREAGIPGQPGAKPLPVWPLRLFQVQICFMFFVCGLEKMKSEVWADGTAMYYVFRLHDFYRMPLPELFTENLMLLKIASWGVVLFEIVAPILIWFKETRRSTLIALILFHLGTDLTMNLMMFHWVMITGWVSFANYDDLRALASYFRPRGRKDRPAIEYPIPQTGV